MKISVPQTPAELKSFISNLDVIILGKAVEWAKQAYKKVMEGLDDAIAESKGDGLTIEHSREVWYQTCVGSVEVKRRQYRNESGRYRYPLDDLVGMGQYQHKTKRVKELTLGMASIMSYRRSAEVLKEASGIDIPHQTIWGW